MGTRCGIERESREVSQPPGTSVPESLAGSAGPFQRHKCSGRPVGAVAQVVWSRRTGARDAQPLQDPADRWRADPVTKTEQLPLNGESPSPGCPEPSAAPARLPPGRSADARAGVDTSSGGATSRRC